MRRLTVLGKNQVTGEVLTSSGTRRQIGYTGIINNNTQSLGDFHTIIGSKPLLPTNKFSRRRLVRRREISGNLVAVLYSRINGNYRDFYVKTSENSQPRLLASIVLINDSCWDSDLASPGEDPINPGEPTPTYFWGSWAVITQDPVTFDNVYSSWTPGLSTNYAIGTVTTEGVWPEMTLDVLMNFGGPFQQTHIYPYVYSRYPNELKFLEEGWQTADNCSLFYFNLGQSKLGYGVAYRASDSLQVSQLDYPIYAQFVVGTKIPHPPARADNHWFDSSNCNNNPDPIWQLTTINFGNNPQETPEAQWPDQWGLIYCDNCGTVQPNPYAPDIVGDYPDTWPPNQFRAYLAATRDGLFWGINDNANCVGWFQNARNGFIDWNSVDSTTTNENWRASFNSVYIDSLLPTSSDPCIQIWGFTKTINFRKTSPSLTNYDVAELIDTANANQLIGNSSATIEATINQLNGGTLCPLTAIGSQLGVEITGIPSDAVIESIVYYPT